jgi:phosphate:Na+ symporter
MLFFDKAVLILTIMGSLALFLFGMKLMSESLQRMGGNRLRNAFSSIASNRLRAISSGLLITGAIQSSSAVTVMLVSFMNAGLLNLSQGLGIMMGANIGTTITAWLVSYFGFHLDFNIILLPILGVALPFMFLAGNQKKSIGEFLTGFAILFLGLQFMRSSFPEVTPDSLLVSYLSNITGSGLPAIILFTGAGLLITLLIQSSSATMALTMVMCHNGWISYESAAAMVLGENLGTTVTANLAAIIANRSARRLALGHTLFNLFGVIWMIVFFSFFVRFSDTVATAITGNSPNGNPLSTPIGLSVFHTSFNLLNTFILVGFIPYFKKLLEIIIPLKENEKKNFKLKYFSPGFFGMSEISLLQAHEEILLFGRHVAYMFSLIPDLLMEKREQKYLKLQKRIFKCEEEADAIESEIRHYLTRTAESDLTQAGSRRVSSMLKIIDDLESMADQCTQMERTINRKNAEKAWFTQEMRDSINNLFNLVKEAIENMNFNLSKEYRPGILAKAKETELKINEMRDRLLNENSQRIEQGEITYPHAAFFSGLVSQCEKLADHIINVNEAIASNVK